MGNGQPVLLIHGSGTGVSAWANWRTVMPALSRQHRVIAPDIVGFGYTDRPDDFQFTRDSWTAHLVAFVDALDLPEVLIVGNSFGGALALWLPRSTPVGYGDSSSWAVPAFRSRSLLPWTRCGGTSLRGTDGGGDEAFRRRPQPDHRRPGPPTLRGIHPTRNRGVLLRDVPLAPPERRRGAGPV
jgi:pimeloyl-ACP methyl ester carboxylesterase